MAFFGIFCVFNSSSVRIANRSVQLFLCLAFVLSSLSFAANVTFKFEEEYVASEDQSNPTFHPFKISKAIFGALRWKFDRDFPIDNGVNFLLPSEFVSNKNNRGPNIKPMMALTFYQ
ncbi:hypothetical protein CEXT_14061 [Caerostris extrusa]|uniref:Uncharacterized protein n=1 Tax=Caerostris extrusa TaxID=172846 RepID=A0AAV4RRR0_CAEEX|nr:hypothetical protein CEXT_14061 [Caerostris extrusa]